MWQDLYVRTNTLNWTWAHLGSWCICSQNGIIYKQQFTTVSIQISDFCMNRSIWDTFKDSPTYCTLGCMDWTSSAYNVKERELIYQGKIMIECTSNNKGNLFFQKQSWVLVCPEVLTLLTDPKQHHPKMASQVYILIVKCSHPWVVCESKLNVYVNAEKDLQPDGYWNPHLEVNGLAQTKLPICCQRCVEKPASLSG